MTPAAERWLGTTSSFPSGRTAKLVLFVVLIGLVALDTTAGDFDLTKSKDWFDLILPWVPLFAFLIGPRTAVVAWFAMFTLVVVLGADPLQVSGTALPTILLLGLCGYVFVWRAAVAFTVGVVVMLAIAVIANPARLGLGGVVTFATLMVLGAAAGIGLSLLTSRLERSARRVAELRAQQARVRAEERTRLAYELHDIVAHDVTVIAMQARRAELVGPEQTGQILERIGDSASQTLQDLRRLVLLLKSDADDDPAVFPGAALEGAAGDLELVDEAKSSSVALAEDLQEVVAQLEQAGFTVQSELEGLADEASESLRQTLRRTLRELSTNILKHGDTHGVVRLRLAFLPDEVTLSASNQISTATPVMSSGTGLEAMRARSDVFGGQLARARRMGAGRPRSRSRPLGP